MTMNAADLLVDYFESRNHSEYRFEALFAALVEIESNIQAWERMGQEVSAFRNALDKWKSELSLTSGPDFKVHNEAGSNLDAGDLGVLRWVSERLSHVTPEIDEGARQNVRDLLNEVRKGVTDDTGLPSDLRLHISRLILHVEDCLDSWSITGDFYLADALDRLFGSIRVAEAVSTDPSLWSKVWADWGKPIAQGLIVSSPTVGLQIAQMLGITAS